MEIEREGNRESPGIGEEKVKIQETAERQEKRLGKYKDVTNQNLLRKIKWKTKKTEESTLVSQVPAFGHIKSAC